MRIQYLGYFGLLLMLSVVVALNLGFLPLKPSYALNRDFLKQAYQRYSPTREYYFNMDHYLNTFPVTNYALFQVEGSSYFLEKDKFDYIKTPLRLGKRWEPHLISYMTKYVKPGTQVVDAGAHIGTHTLYFSKLLGKGGQVYAFEPQKKLFVELNANLLANQVENVKTIRSALGDRFGKIEMNRPDPVNEGGTAIGQGGDQATVITLDSLGLKNVSLIKIDVEGYEDQVLDGARQTIKANKPVILCEVQGQVERAKATPAEKAKIQHTLAKLHSMGYRTVRLAETDYLALPLGSSYGLAN